MSTNALMRRSTVAASTKFARTSMEVTTATQTQIPLENARAGTTSVPLFQRPRARFLLTRCLPLADALQDFSGESTGLEPGDVTISMSALLEITDAVLWNTVPILLDRTLVFVMKVLALSVLTSATLWPSADHRTPSEATTVTASPVTTETETDRTADSSLTAPMDQRDALTSMNAKLELTSALKDRPASTRSANTSALLDTILSESALPVLITAIHSLPVSQLTARLASNALAKLVSTELESPTDYLTSKTLPDVSTLTSAPADETNALLTSSVSTSTADTLAAENTIHLTNALLPLANLLRSAFPTHMSTLASLARISMSASKEPILALLSSSASTLTSALDSSAEVSQIQDRNALQALPVRWNALLRNLLAFPLQT